MTNKFDRCYVVFFVGGPFDGKFWWLPYKKPEAKHRIVVEYWIKLDNRILEIPERHIYECSEELHISDAQQDFRYHYKP